MAEPIPTPSIQAKIPSASISEPSPLPTPIITTKRLLIRSMHPQDAPSMLHHQNSPAVKKYMSLVFCNSNTLTHTNAWIAFNISTSPPINFVICELSAPGTVIGGIGLKLGGDYHSHTAEVGYWIGELFWGKGYMTEVLEGFTKWGFEEWERDGHRLRRLFGRVNAGNVGSMRCFEKVGYVKEGVFKGDVEKDGVMSDTHAFGLTKGEWEGKVSI